MLTSIIATLLLGPIPQTGSFSLAPTDDVWVYTHASNPAKDEYLRIWGSDAHSYAPTTEESEEFAYGYLRWDVSSLPTDKKLTSAKLVLMSAPDPAYTVDYAKSAPIEARTLKGKFTEKTWDYGMIKDVQPDEPEFGDGAPNNLPGDGKPVEIEVDMMKMSGTFAKYLAAAQKDGNALYLALTSKLDPNEVGQKGVYKVYSKDATDEKLRPKLKLQFSDGSGRDLAAIASRSR